MPITILIKNARLSFDKNLFDPTEAKGKKSGKRGCNLIASDVTKFYRFADNKKTEISRKDFDKLLEEAMKEKFGKVYPKFENWAVRKNSEAVSATSGERYSGYEDDNGIYFAPTRYEDQGYPAYVRKDAKMLDGRIPSELSEARQIFYAGCYVHAKINIGAFETKEDNVTKRGVTSFLEAIQFHAEGEKFGGGSANADGFDAEDEDDEDDEELPEGM